MKDITVLVHGLGQNESSWKSIKNSCYEDKIKTVEPNLFKLIKNKECIYDNVYTAFCKYLNSLEGKINLVGISLGGILALNYAIDYPEKVSSIILIGVPFKMPKMLLKFQNIVFKLITEKNFEQIGCSKKQLLSLTKSMENLDYIKKLNKIKCDTCIICGEKDKANIKSMRLLKENIKNSKMALIENAGHVVNIENPEDLYKKVKEFWSNLENK